MQSSIIPRPALSSSTLTRLVNLSAPLVLHLRPLVSLAHSNAQSTQTLILTPSTPHFHSLIARKQNTIRHFSASPHTLERKGKVYVADEILPKSQSPKSNSQNSQRTQNPFSNPHSSTQRSQTQNPFSSPFPNARTQQETTENIARLLRENFARSEVGRKIVWRVKVVVGVLAVLGVWIVWKFIGVILGGLIALGGLFVR